MIDEKVLKEAVDKWGTNAQIDMIIEECAELIVALQKLKRNYGKDPEKDKELMHNVCDEVADVKLMTKQADYIFDEKLISERVKFKVKRLIKRLK